MKTLHLLAASALALLSSCSKTQEAASGNTTIDLFSGTDLTSWEGNPKLWSVQDGAITGITPPDPANPTKGILKHNTFLVWKGGTVGDFELTFQYRIEKGNSGVQYRSKALPPGEFGPIISGYQADFEAGDKYSGILYEERGRGILAERGQRTRITEVNGQTKITKVGDLSSSAELQANIKANDWNDYVIVADGNHLNHFINGRMTIDVVDDQPSKAARSGVLALQIHAGPPMLVQFKDIRIKRLP